jgi:hypothetical protein
MTAIQQKHHRETLMRSWKDAFGSPAPRHLQSKFLELALGWHRQMQDSLMWRDKAGRNRLRRLLRGDTRTGLTPGSRLVREWQGEVYHVLVLPKGFEMNGQGFRSLSAIARHITGTPWSGPLFFGVDL